MQTEHWTLLTFLSRHKDSRLETLLRQEQESVWPDGHTWGRLSTCTRTTRAARRRMVAVFMMTGEGAELDCTDRTGSLPASQQSAHYQHTTHYQSVHTQTGILSNDQFDVNCKYAKNIYEFTFKCFCNFNLFIPFLSLETKIKVTKATQLQLFLILRLCEGFIKVFYFYIQSREIN